MALSISPRAITAALLLAFLLTLAAGAVAERADAQATRTWISGGTEGDDVNPCSRTAPCRTLSGAMNKTAEGGEINALTPAATGAVSINKSITIDMSSAYGGAIHSFGDGIRVVAGTDDNVVLRGLDIKNVSPSAPCGTLSVDGVFVESARSVRIENTRLDGEAQGVRVAPTSGAVDVSLDGVEIRNSCTSGLSVEPGAAASASVAIRDTSITNSGTGVRVADRGRAWLTDSLVFGNARGLETVGTGQIDLFADTRVFGNTVDGTPTRTLGAPAAGATGATGPAGPPGTPGTPGAKGDPAYKLLLALPKTRLKAKRGKRVSLRYLATAPARTTLEVRKGRRVIARVRGRAREGMNKLRWNGKRGRKKAKPGRYKLRLRATSSDGQVATKSARLRLKR